MLQKWSPDINEQGDIVGSYSDPADIGHGLMLRDGVFTTINVPGADTTRVTGINSQGETVCAYRVAGSAHGFVAR